jgi:hypothetical protein
MDALRVAHAFRRPDVDAFLDEIDAEQYAEWLAFFQLEPQDWQATRIAIRRLSFMQAMCAGAKKPRERDYDVVLGDNLRSPENERARWEAMSVRTGLQRTTRKRGTRGKENQ